MAYPTALRTQSQYPPFYLITTIYPTTHSFIGTVTSLHCRPTHPKGQPYLQRHPITMSAPKSKKVHYERGTTKGSKHSSHHRHHSSRDSGVGSSSASDRASLGTNPNEYEFDERQVEDQRYNLSVVQEALDAANEEIKHLKALNASLNESLAESHKENRTLKKEKIGLHKENKDLVNAIEELNSTLKRSPSPRTAAAALNSERRPSSRKGSDSPRQMYAEERPRPNHGERRSSGYDYTPPRAPHPPHNPYPNPFEPRTSGVSYASVPTSVAYAPSTASYATSPLYTLASQSSNRHSKQFDDGKYHLQPL